MKGTTKAINNNSNKPPVPPPFSVDYVVAVRDAVSGVINIGTGTTGTQIPLDTITDQMGPWILDRGSLIAPNNGTYIIDFSGTFTTNSQTLTSLILRVNENNVDGTQTSNRSSTRNTDLNLSSGTVYRLRRGDRISIFATSTTPNSVATQGPVGLFPPSNISTVAYLRVIRIL